MANLKLNSVSLATESGGTVSLDSGVASIPSAGLTGTIPSGVTFPAGHVIQVVTNAISSNSSTTTSTTPVRLTSHYATITGVASGNDVWIIMSCISRLDSTSYSPSMGTGVNLYRESTEIRSAEGHTWYHNNAHNTGQKTYLDTITFNHLDTSPAVGTNNYYIGHEVYDAGHYSTITTDAPFTMTLMEIQR